MAEQVGLGREREERLAEEERRRAETARFVRVMEEKQRRIIEELHINIEQSEHKRDKAKFKSDRSRKKTIFALAGMGVAALVLYKLFTSEEIPSNEILNLID